MSWEADFLAGLAQTLADADIATWRPDTAYAADETAIVLSVVPAAPDKVITLSLYLDEPVPGLTDVTAAVQIRFRAGTDPNDLADMADAVYQLLHESGPHVWGVAYVTRLWRDSVAPLGQDPLGRLERADNYYLRGHRPHSRLE
ncbi:minor capsid protein [Herbidospora mongoliensis]|uniref:minor capsid protein n=1 Tax=Herbidospora mongoliensis TaxID=688067 RepID=UPI00082DF021|nr:minor capsid protein [Herbidospora mongoliensis]